jgi:hypothetical protein
METPPRFQIGNRVRTIRYFAGIAAGSMGTVVRTFASSNFYSVLFDGVLEPQILRFRDLELMSLAPPSLTS